MATGKTHTIKFQSVTLDVRPWRHPSGRDYWRAAYHDAAGRRKFITRSTLAEAKSAAHAKAIEIGRGTVDLSALSPAVMRRLHQLLDADPHLAMIDDFLAWKRRAKPEKPACDAVTEFLAVKEANAGLSTQNVRTLRKHLAPLVDAIGQRALADVTPAELETLLVANPKNGNRTRRNIRASWVTFFRWCREMEYLPEGRTAAERVGTPIVAQGIPDTYSPGQLRAMLDAVRPEYLPWLAVAAFAGVRTDEICPIAGSRKSPLDWEDFQWGRDIIIIRPQTAKTKRRRVVPILPALRAWLDPIRKDAGPIHADTPAPTKRPKGRGQHAETARLGGMIGGWLPNALRHSFISYRAAVVGLGQTAMEAGNSEAEAKASYNDAKGRDEADEWFSVFPNVLNSGDSARGNK